MRLHRVVFASALACASGAVGCAEVQPAASIGYADVTYAPLPVADYTTYPYTWYGHRPVYLIRGQWWYRDGDGRWGYYRSEPDHLARMRESIEHPTPIVRSPEPHPESAEPSLESLAPRR